MHKVMDYQKTKVSSVYPRKSSWVGCVVVVVQEKIELFYWLREAAVVAFIVLFFADSNEPEAVVVEWKSR